MLHERLNIERIDDLAIGQNVVEAKQGDCFDVLLREELQQRARGRILNADLRRFLRGRQTRQPRPLEEAVQHVLAHGCCVDRLRLGGILDIRSGLGERDDGGGHKTLLVGGCHNRVGRPVDPHRVWAVGRAAMHGQDSLDEVEVDLFFRLVVVGDDHQHHIGVAGLTDVQAQWPQRRKRGACCRRCLFAGVVGDACPPVPSLSRYGLRDVPGAAGRCRHDNDTQSLGEVGVPEVADAVVHGEGFAGNDNVRDLKGLDLDQERIRLDVADGQGEVRQDSVAVPRAVGGRFDQIRPAGQVLIESGVDPRAPVVVGADDPSRGRYQGEDGVALLRVEIDTDATSLWQVEGVGVGGMARHEA